MSGKKEYPFRLLCKRCNSYRYTTMKFIGTISVDCAIQLRDVLNLLYPVSAGEVAKPVAPPPPPPYTPKVGDRVIVCDEGLAYVKVAAGMEATISRGGYYTLKFDEPVPCDGGTSEKHWIAKLSEISPAPTTKPDAPYAPKVGDRVVICDKGLFNVKAAAGKEATISCGGYYTLKFDEPVPCDGGTSEKHWIAKLSEISPAPAPSKPYIPRIIVTEEIFDVTAAVEEQP